LKPHIKLILARIRSKPVPSLQIQESTLYYKLQRATEGKVVLEFGSGISTIKISEVARKIVSVESDAKFIKLLQPLIKKSSTTQIYYANIGPVRHMGTPMKLLKLIFKYRYSNYYQKVFKFLPSYDVVFVDGRFRVACMAQSYLSADKGCILICDDFFNRPEYHVVLQFLGTPKVFFENTAMWTLDPTDKTLHKAREILKSYLHDSR
jgi:predicted O-methyltransferase YrrM